MPICQSVRVGQVSKTTKIVSKTTANSIQDYPFLYPKLPELYPRLPDSPPLLSGVCLPGVYRGKVSKTPRNCIQDSPFLYPRLPEIVSQTPNFVSRTPRLFPVCPECASQGSPGGGVSKTPRKVPKTPKVVSNTPGVSKSTGKVSKSTRQKNSPGGGGVSGSVSSGESCPGWRCLAHLEGRCPPGLSWSSWD